MNPTFSSLKLALTSLCGLVLLAGCDKKEPIGVAPAPEVAPVPAIPAEVAAAPAEAAAAPALTGEAAMEAFKAEIKAIKAFMEANQGNTDPVAAFANLREFIKRAAAVDTSGLPEDLSAAYQNMNGVMMRLQGSLDDLPVPVDQLPKYMEEEKAKGGAAAEEVMAKRAAFDAAMAAHQKDGEAASAKLKEVGAKYGIESLDLGGGN